jgi:hypothetical protein
LCLITGSVIVPRHSFLLKASHTRLAFIRDDMLHPTTFLEYRSITTARYNQPSVVQT